MEKTQVDRIQASILASALEMYHKHKIKVNRAYTPSNMLQTATNITGEKFKRGQYLEAAKALRTYAEEKNG